jgi:branched-chain amino acid transport system permease protein
LTKETAKKMPSFSFPQLGMFAIAFGAMTTFPLYFGDSALFLTTDLLIMALFACSFNLIFGKAGMLSFGHAAFYGGGAYVVALLEANTGLPFWVAFASAPVAAGLVAFGLGIAISRVGGIILAMVTLAFGQLTYTLATALYAYTGGDDGLPVNLPAWLLKSGFAFEFILIVVTFCLLFLYVIWQSAFGMALQAIQDNPQRASFAGLNIKAYRVAAFVIAGSLAGVAGALRVVTQQMAFPGLLHWSQSAEPILMALIGGIDTFIGPIIGAAFFVLFNFFLTSTTDYPLLAFGILVLLSVLFLPKGIAGSLIQIWNGERRAPEQ